MQNPITSFTGEAKMKSKATATTGKLTTTDTSQSTSSLYACAGKMRKWIEEDNRG